MKIRLDLQRLRTDHRQCGNRAQCLDRALPRQRSAATSSSWDAPSMSWDAPGRSISRGSSVGRSGEWDTFTTELRGGR